MVFIAMLTVHEIRMETKPCKRCLNQPAVAVETDSVWIICRHCGIAVRVGPRHEREGIEIWNRGQARER